MSNPFSVIIKEASSENNLNCRQLAIFSFVYANNILTSVKEYADRLGISKPAVTRALDRLEELNLIQRKDDAKDHRRIIVTPTQHGYSYFNQLVA